jgi:hypothetical protein
MEYYFFLFLQLDCIAGIRKNNVAYVAKTAGKR